MNAICAVAIFCGLIIMTGSIILNVYMIAITNIIFCGIYISIYIMYRNYLITTISRGLGVDPINKTLTHTVSFCEYELKLRIENNRDAINVNYAYIHKIIETKSTYTPTTKTKQIIIINKATLIKMEENESFLKFLMNKCVNIKSCKLLRKISNV